VGKFFLFYKCFEARNVGEGMRVAVDCAALEAYRPRSREAAGFARVHSSGEEDGVKKMLGLLHLKLDRILYGLSLRPKRWRKKKRCKVLGLDVGLEKEPGLKGVEDPNLGLDPGLGHVLVPGSDLDLGLDLVPDSNPDLDSGFRSDFKQSPSSGDPGAVSRSPVTQMEIPPNLLGCLPEFTLTQGSGAEAGTVKAVIGVVGDMSAQEEGSFGVLQVHSSRSPELLTEKPPNSPERSPELLLTHGSGVDDGIGVETFTGTVGDSSAQREDSNGEPPVRYPDFHLPWESDSEADGESESGESIDGETNSVVSVPMDPPPVKSMIKRGFFGPRAAVSSTVVIESPPDPAGELIRRGSLSVGMADLDRDLSHPMSPKSGISKPELEYFRRVKEKAAKQRSKNKELLVEDLDDGVQGYSNEVHRTMKMASVMGVTWGGEDKKMLDTLAVRERKAKGLRELKNLDCSVSPVKSQRRQGRNSSKFANTFPREVH
jgi:hypothetical protein